MIASSHHQSCMIKPLWSWIVTWLAAVCLLLIAGGEARPDYRLAAATSRAGSVELGRESLALFSSVRLSGLSSCLIPSRAGPNRSVLSLCVLLRPPDVGLAGPPWLDERGPPGKFLGPWASCTAAAQAGSPKQGTTTPVTLIFPLA